MGKIITQCVFLHELYWQKQERKKHKEKRNQTSKIWHNLSINESVQIEIISCLSYYFFNFKCIFIGLETKVIFFKKVHTLHKIQNLKKNVPLLDKDVYDIKSLF